MEKRCGWSAPKLKHLAQALIYAPKDLVTRIDQNAARSLNTLFEELKRLAPISAADKTYGAQTAKSTRAKSGEVAADI